MIIIDKLTPNLKDPSLASRQYDMIMKTEIGGVKVIWLEGEIKTRRYRKVESCAIKIQRPIIGCDASHIQLAH